MHFQPFGDIIFIIGGDTMKLFFDTCTNAVNYTNETKSFGVFFSRTKSQSQNVHIHDCCEIFLCLSGGKNFLIDDKVYTIADGDLFVINQFEAHKVVPDSQNEFVRYVLHVHPDFLYSNSLGEANLASCFYSSEKITKTHLSKEELSKLTELFESLNNSYPYGDELFKKIRIIEILLETSKFFSTHQISTPKITNHKTIQMAIDYINNNYASPLDLETVAKNSFISSTQLSRLFNQYCGTTVTKYIISKRITEAKKCLSEGENVTDTAFLCGFNDYANFIRTFKKIVGVPPGKYKSNFTK